MKVVTSVTVWNDAVGKRISITYSDISESGTMLADNKRIDRVIQDNGAKNSAEGLMSFAQSLIEEA